MLSMHILLLNSMPLFYQKLLKWRSLVFDLSYRTKSVANNRLTFQILKSFKKKCAILASSQKDYQLSSSNLTFPGSAPLRESCESSKSEAGATGWLWKCNFSKNYFWFLRRRINLSTEKIANSITYGPNKSLFTSKSFFWSYLVNLRFEKLKLPVWEFDKVLEEVGSKTGPY